MDLKLWMEKDCITCIYLSMSLNDLYKGTNNGIPKNLPKKGLMRNNQPRQDDALTQTTN